MRAYEIICNAGIFVVISEDEYSAKINFTMRYSNNKIQKIREINEEEIYEVYPD